MPRTVDRGRGAGIGPEVKCLACRVSRRLGAAVAAELALVFRREVEKDPRDQQPVSATSAVTMESSTRGRSGVTTICRVTRRSIARWPCVGTAGKEP